MESGAITSPKDLERMQHEMDSLERRISDLEDVELDVMERLEEAQATLRDLGVQAEQLEREIASLTTVRDEKAGDVTVELEQITRDRETAASGLPEPLLALYERLRASKNGVGAAALRARQCGGCRLTLNAADLGVIAKTPSDEVIRCEECDRILVRTLESGI